MRLRTSPGLGRLALVVVVALASPAAAADAGPPAAPLAPAPAAQAAGPAPAPALAPVHEVEARLLLALPAALPTGTMTGVEAAYMHGRGWLRWGAGVSWGTATEYTLIESVRNDDVRLRLYGAVQRRLGRGTVALRLGLGGTLVYEDRTRAQGSRAGLTGSALSQSVWSMLPGGELEARVTLRVIGPFALTLGGGPTLHVVDGHARAGWLAGLGVAWLR